MRRKVLFFVFLGALLAVAEAPCNAARGAGNDLAGFFDGARAAPANLRTIVSSIEVPMPKGKPVVLPGGLSEAAGSWDNPAQVARLLGDNPTPKNAFSFAVIGDAERGRFPWQRIFLPGGDAYRKQLRSIAGQNPDFVVQLGDFVSKGTFKNYKEYIELLRAEQRLPLFSIIGNHERSKPNGKANKSLYREAFGAPDFFFDYNGWRFIGLDTADRRLTPAQLEWLEKTLSTSLPCIIFTHVPPRYLRKLFSTYDPSAASNENFNLSGWFEEGSERFGELVARHRVKRVYMGHIHAFGMAEKDGVRYVLSGGGGSPLYPLPPGYPQHKMAHYLLISVGPDGLRETAHEINGRQFDLPWLHQR